MSEQEILPGVEEPPKLLLLTEMEIANYRKALIEADGDIDAAGISLETMRNIIFTCRRKANPMEELDSGIPAKGKRKSSTPSTNTAKISGDDVDSFLG